MFSRFRKNSSSTAPPSSPPQADAASRSPTTAGEASSSLSGDGSSSAAQQQQQPSVSFEQRSHPPPQSPNSNAQNEQPVNRAQAEEEGRKLLRRPSLARRLSNTFLRRKSSSGTPQKSSSSRDLDIEPEDGSTRTVLLTWGRNDYGQLLRGNEPSVAVDENAIIGGTFNVEEHNLVQTCSAAAFDSEVSQFSFGLFHSIVNTSRGSTWGGGDNDDGQLQVSGSKSVDLTKGPKQLKGPDALSSKACSVSVGLKHSALVTHDGIVLTWGSNESGQLGHSKDPGTRLAPRQLDGNVRRERGVQVACSEGATFILTERGQVWSTGEGTRGELGRPETLETGCSWMASPILDRLFCTPVSMVVAGAAHVVAVTVTGNAFGWGWNRHGQLGFKPKSDTKRFEASPVPLVLPDRDDSNIRWVACGTSHTALLTQKGTVLTAGSNEHWQLGREVEASHEFGFGVVRTNIKGKVVKVVCGAYHTVALAETGAVYAWGSNEFGEISKREEHKESLVIREPVECINRLAVDISAGGSCTAVLLLKPLGSGREDDDQQRRRFKAMMQARLESIPRLHELDANMLIRLAMESQQTNSLAGLKGALLELHATGLNRSFLCQTTTSRVDVTGVEMALGELWATMSKKKDGEKLLVQRLGQLHHELLDLSAVATEPDQLRAFFIALLNPACDHLAAPVYATLVKAAASLREESLNLIAQWSVADLTPERFIERLLKPLIGVVDAAAERLDWSSRGCAPAAIRILSKLHTFSERVQGGFVMFDKFYTTQPSKWAHHVVIHEWQRYVHRDRQQQQQQRRSDGAWDNNANNIGNFSLFDHPFVLSAETKRNIMMYDQQNSQLKNAVITALSQSGSPFFEFTVRRDHILEDALDVLLRAKKNDLTKPLRVAFENEPGLDWGGVRKEFFDLLSAALFDPAAQDMFCRPDPDTNPTLLWLNARGDTARLVVQAEQVQQKRRQRILRSGVRGADFASSHLFVADAFNCPKKCCTETGLQVFVTPNDGYTCDVCGADVAKGEHVFSCRQCDYDVCRTCREEEDVPQVTAAWRRVVLVGALMGLAVYNSTLLDVHFPLALYSGLLDQPIRHPTLADLKSIDASLAKGLQTMLEFPTDDPETFSDIYGDQRFFLEDVRVDLIDNGRDIPVTMENRELYVRRRCEYEVREGVEPLLRALMTGFRSVVDVHGDAMSLFSPPELELMIVGVPDLDFAALEQVSKYEGGYSGSTQVVKWFWEICKHELDETQQRQLLMFVTGAPRAPIGGLAVQSFLIQRAGPDSDQLPTAHTCFNTLLLPEYSSKTKLMEKLRVALMNAQGFGLQ